VRPIKPFFRTCWHGACACSRGALAAAHWTAWIILLTILGVQIFIFTAQQLTLPAFVIRQLAANAETYGLKAEFGRAQFDPLGRILLENVRLSPSSVEGPIVTISAAFLKVDAWALLTRDVRVEELELIGVDLLVPAMFSPTGTEAKLVKDLNARLRPGPSPREWEITALDGRIGTLTLAARGAIALPGPVGPILDPREYVATYLRFARAVAPELVRLDQLMTPHLSLVLTPDPATLARVDAHFTAEAVALSADRGGFSAPTFEKLVATSSFALRSSAPSPLEIVATVGDLTLPEQASIHRIDARVRGTLSRAPLRFAPNALELAASRAGVRGFSVQPLSLQLQSLDEQGLAFDAQGVVEGTEWITRGLIDPKDRSGTITAQGRMPLPLLEKIGALTGIALVDQLAYSGAPRIEAAARLGPGGVPLSVEGSFAGGPVIARSVALEAASARFAWAGSRLRVSDVVLKTPGSRAQGSYEMDTKTQAFRFLLAGTLQPGDINGWFRDWWPRFWTNFDFADSVPRAGVEVAGFWGKPLATAVFVAVEGEDAGLRGVALDQVSARLFIRPGFVDVLDFNARIGEHWARGRFVRIAESGTGLLRELEFAVTSDLAVAEAAQLAGPAIVRAVAPFVFEHPPQIRAVGRIEGPASPVGEHQRITLSGESQGAAAFYGFPVRNLRFTARVDDDDVHVDDIAAVFAGGDLRGQATLQALSGEQRLGFDAVLTAAELGRSIQTVEDYSSARAGRAPSPQSRFQQKIAAGRLDLALSAEGTARDIFSFNGTGNAQISGAELGEINMLGILSALLRRTLLNFSTLQLDAARANFTLEGRKLAFSEVKITGPQAALDAQGDYFLDTKAVAFTSKIYPFQESRGIIGSAVGAVLAPFSQVLEVELTGQLAKPDWAFVLGPTNLLRSILGIEPDSRESVPPPSSEPTPPPGG
jgi:hypothetical protein